MSLSATPTVDPKSETPPRRRRWIPLSLRLFFGINLFLGIGGALWLGIPAYRQHAALREIGDRPKMAVSLRPVGPGWLRRWLGNNRMRMFDQVVGLELADDGTTDAHLAYLTGLPYLRRLTIFGTRVTDEGLSQLQGLSQLRHLSLDGRQFTDEGLRHLGRLKNLEYINLRYTEVTDVGLFHLNDLANLKCLRVPTALTKAGVRNWKLTRSRTAWPVFVTGAEDDYSADDPARIRAMADHDIQLMIDRDEFRSLDPESFAHELHARRRNVLEQFDVGASR